MITLKINNEIVAEKAYAKYLGIIFDNKLTWLFHIEHIALKLNKSNGLIAKLRHFISLDKLKLIYRLSHKKGVAQKINFLEKKNR